MAMVQPTLFRHIEPMKRLDFSIHRVKHVADCEKVFSGRLEKHTWLFGKQSEDKGDYVEAVSW